MGVNKIISSDEEVYTSSVESRIPVQRCRAMSVLVGLWRSLLKKLSNPYHSLLAEQFPCDPHDLWSVSTDMS